MRVGATFERDDAGGFVVDDLDVEQSGARPQVRECVIRVGVDRREGLAAEGDLVGVLHEGNDGNAGIFARVVVAGLDAHVNRIVPVRLVERDEVSRHVALDLDVEAVVGVQVDQVCLALAVLIEHQLGDDDVADVRLLGQFDEDLIPQAGVVVRIVGVRDQVLRDHLALDHQRAAIFGKGAGLDLGDVHARRVVVAQADLDVAHRYAVIAVVGRDHAVLRDHHTVALGAEIVHRVEIDRLFVHVVELVEDQHDGARRFVVGRAVDVVMAAEVLERVDRRRRTGHPQRVAFAIHQRERVRQNVVGLFLRRPCCGHRHVHLLAGVRLDGQVDHVLVQGQASTGEHVIAALADGRAAARFGDHHQPCLCGGHVVVEPVDRQAVVSQVVGADQVIDRAADAFQLARYDVGGNVAGDVDAVGPEASDHAVGHAKGGGLDEELIVALEAVDLDHLDGGVAHVQAGAEDAL